MKTNNYFQFAPRQWMRRPGTELDRLCEKQRTDKISNINGFRYRRQSMTDTYHYWREAGESRKDAYEKAQMTQLMGLKPCAINLDARTTLFPVMMER